jgi:hypothetical protein
VCVCVCVREREREREQKGRQLTRVNEPTKEANKNRLTNKRYEITITHLFCGQNNFVFY